MTVTQAQDLLHGRTIRCGACKERHSTVHEVRECYEAQEAMAESQADHLAETDHESGRGDYYADGPVWSNYGGWVA